MQTRNTFQLRLAWFFHDLLFEKSDAMKLHEESQHHSSSSKDLYFQNYFLCWKQEMAPVVSKEVRACELTTAAVTFQWELC